MSDAEGRKIQGEVARFVELNGHGAVTRLARAAKLTPQFVGLVNLGKKIPSRKAAEQLRSGLDEIQKQSGAVITDQSLSGVKDPVDAIAVQLEGMLVLMRDKEKFDYRTRLAITREGIAGVYKHLMPVAERWLEKSNVAGEAEGRE